METVAHEREVQLLQAWPFHVMATTAVATAGCSPDDSTDYGCSSGGSSASGDCFVLGWEPPLLGCCFDVHELFPLFADTEASSLLPIPSPPPARDAVAVPQDLDDLLLLDFWDASCHDGDVGAQQQHQVQVAFNSGCCLPLQLQLPHETETSSGSATTATTSTTNSFFPCDDYDDPLSSIFQTGPALAEKALLLAPADPPSSSSSNSHADPCGSDASGAKLVQFTTTATPSAERAPPPPPRFSSLKRTTTREAESESGGNGKRRRKASMSGVVRPFALLKPDGLDGGATLADVNARVLTRPARPVRHPVGEFACAPPRASAADRPGISGKPVSSFTRLHTPGRGTITVIRTRG